MTELTWIAEGRKHIGLREIKGAKHNPTLLKWLICRTLLWDNG